MNQTPEPCPFCDNESCTCKADAAAYQERQAREAAEQEARWAAEEARYNALSPAERTAYDRAQGEAEEAAMTEAERIADGMMDYTNDERTAILCEQASREAEAAYADQQMNQPSPYGNNREDGPEEPCIGKDGRRYTPRRATKATKKVLTPKQEAAIIGLAKDKNVLRLFEGDSLNGYSYTLRYAYLCRNRPGGPCSEHQSHPERGQLRLRRRIGHREAGIPR